MVRMLENTIWSVSMQEDIISRELRLPTKYNSITVNLTNLEFLFQKEQSEYSRLMLLITHSNLLEKIALITLPKTKT